MNWSLHTLLLNVDPSTKSIAGTTGIEGILTASSTLLVLYLVSYYKISSITVNGKKEPNAAD
ncbi:MAG TPA: hypothetical protein VK616_07010 [Flavitalea sp.]|nr:hypothetical protein [Flavitalea sp.]